MTADQVKSLLLDTFSESDIHVEGEGAKYMISIVSALFEGKRAVPRQQMVYALLNEHISSGEIHAVSMDLKTPEEA
ncbi:BolA family protein [Reinekea sp.]|jgi:acid stress-induced BolA-like protein IbaG/YrbA|uniref:BolA family protein n=1 Tax=Reinekea sp. TaxID=1970455 RepID=UPI0039890914